MIGYVGLKWRLVVLINQVISFSRKHAKNPYLVGFFRLPKILFCGHDIFADWDLQFENLLRFPSK